MFCAHTLSGSEFRSVWRSVLHGHQHSGCRGVEIRFVQTVLKCADETPDEMMKHQPGEIPLAFFVGNADAFLQHNGQQPIHQLCFKTSQEDDCSEAEDGCFIGTLNLS